MNEPMYIPVLKGKAYKPVTWSAMLALRCTVQNLKWRIVCDEESSRSNTTT